MKRFLLLMISGIFASAAATAQLSPPTATEILNEAYQIANKENKHVFILFHASWCTWCHRMDKSMNEPGLKQYFDDNFVIRHLVVDETEAKRSEETPGAKEFRTKYGGDGQGIPFWLILDKDGKLLADSKLRVAGASPDTPGTNVGCPAAEEEVAYFIDLLRKYTRLESSQLEEIRKRFRENDQ